MEELVNYNELMEYIFDKISNNEDLNELSIGFEDGFEIWFEDNKPYLAWHTDSPIVHSYRYDNWLEDLRLYKGIFKDGIISKFEYWSIPF